MGKYENSTIEEIALKATISMKEHEAYKCNKPLQKEDPAIGRSYAIGYFSKQTHD